MFKLLNQKRKIVLAQSFNEAALYANASATGYLTYGKVGAVLSPALLLASRIGFDMLETRSRLKEDVRMWPEFVRFLDEEDPLVRDVTVLKHKMGVKQDVHVVVVKDVTRESGVLGPSIAHNRQSAFFVLPHRYFGPEYTPADHLAIAAHEFGHVNGKHGEKTQAFFLGGAVVNTLHFMAGLLRSMVDFSLVPLAAAAGGALLHHVLQKRALRLYEYDCDAQAAGARGKDIVDLLKKLLPPPEMVGDQAIAERDADDRRRFSIAPPALRHHFMYGMHGRHPLLYKRIREVENIIRDRDPAYVSQPLYGGIKFIWTKDAVGAQTEKKQKRLTAYVERAFQNTYGHENVRVTYVDYPPPRQPSSGADNFTL